jgi:hypothetical protein
MFPHSNVHKFTWTSPDGKTHNQTDHIFTERSWHPSLSDVQPFRGANCVINHCLVVAKVRDRLAVSIQTTQKFDMERFNINKSNEVEGKEQSWVEISKSLSALENLHDDDINTAWEKYKNFSQGESTLL